MDNITEKKKKKKKSQKNLDESFQSDSTLDRGENPKEKKEKKKKKKLYTNLDEELALDSTLNSSNTGKPYPADADVSNVETKKKKKKKKTHLDSSMDDSHMEVHDDDTSRKRNSSGAETSPAKKQKKMKRESIEVVNEDEMEKHVEENGQDTDSWTKQEKLDLLDRIHNEKLTQTEGCSFRLTLGKPQWNWENICTEKRTAEDCQAAFFDILQEVQKIKTLKQIVEAAKTHIEKGGRKAKTPFNLFMKEYCMKHKGQKSTDLTSICNIWKGLSEDEKAKYRQAVKETNDKNKPPARPRQPFDIFYSEKCESTGNKSKEKRIIYKKKYDELKLKKKLKYIEMSFNEIYEYEKQAQEYKERFPEWEKKSWEIKKSFTNKENCELYLHTLHGMPRQPPLQGNITYYHELLESGKLDDVKGKEKLTSALKTYAQLPETDKSRYQESTKQKLNEYHEKYAEWRKKQDEIVGTFADKYYKPEKPPKETKPKQPKEKTKKIKQVHTFDNKITTSMTRPKFAGEPKAPPATAYRLFAANFMVQAKTQFSSLKDKTLKMNKAWEELNADQKQMYQNRCEELRKKYTKHLLTYVANLDKHERKTYLGYHRATHYKFFKTDIFEESYPNAKYPVFISSPVKKMKKVKSTSVSEMKSLSSDDEEESTNLKGQKKMAEQHSHKSPLDQLDLLCSSSSDEIEEESQKQTDSDPSTNSDEDNLQKVIPTNQESESDFDDDDDEVKQENESDSDEDIDIKEEIEPDYDEDVETKQGNEFDSGEDGSSDEEENISKAWQVNKSATKKEESSSSSDDSD